MLHFLYMKLNIYSKLLRWPNTTNLKVRVAVVMVAVGALGYVVVRSLAAGPLAAFEAEGGTLNGTASVVAQTAASGGSMVQFNGAAPTPTPTGGSLSLSRIPWEGGSGYWSQFPKANAAGWDDPSFFPITVFMGNPEHAAELKALGINTFAPAEHRAGTLSYIDNTPGMFVLPGDEWTPAEIGNRANAVGWFISDECEMGYSGCDGTEAQILATQQSYVTARRNLNDGRFVMANFGNGILRTFWASTTMNQHVQMMDVSSADKYTYTSAFLWGLVPNSPDWPSGATVSSSASYGWQVDQMKRFQDQSHLRPIWTFIETARPYLTEPGALTITPNQLEGAVWSAIIHEARGISYFQHNNDDSLGCRGAYSLVDCSGTAFGNAMYPKITAVNAQVKALAPVINTQSYYNASRVVNGFTYYYYSFNNGTDAMLKTYNGSAYIFADIGLQQSTGNKTFTLPTGVNGTTVEVIGENRTISVSNRQFTDNFASEYSHHIYRISL